ncbi:MAG TPA: allantoinase AllB [Acidilobales archaeon]|nr:allantoinase AllB [Acidilobales archaeon]
MSEGNLVVRNGTIVTPDGIYQADIVIEEGVIREIGKNLSKPSGFEVIDAKGMLVLPGIVDEHVHMREPGLEYKDDFTHGTMAAAAGGVTTVIEMPNTLPPVENSRILRNKAALLSKKAYVDFALTGVLHDANIHEFEDMLSEGAVGFKVFLGPTTGDIPAPNDGSLYEILLKSSKYNVTIAFHAENWNLVKYFTEKVKKTGRRDPLVHTDSRPPICEEDAIQKLILYSKRTGGRVLIVHMSAKEGIVLLRHARISGLNVYGETCPHYLYLDSSDYAKYGSLMKVNPPIRDRSHKEELWRAIRDGTITNLGSDHAPHTIEEKKRDIWNAASGFIGVQTFLPLMINAALEGLMPITKIPELMAQNPAKLYGLYPKKGVIRVGSDGDLVIVDPKEKTVIKREDLYSKNPITPFIGWRLKGRVKYTILRGHIIAKDFKVIVEKPLGSLIKRSYPS